jgi:hypothetical protein
MFIIYNFAEELRCARRELDECKDKNETLTERVRKLTEQQHYDNAVRSSPPRALTNDMSSEMIIITKELDEVRRTNARVSGKRVHFCVQLTLCLMFTAELESVRSECASLQQRYSIAEEELKTYALFVIMFCICSLCVCVVGLVRRMRVLLAIHVDTAMNKINCDNVSLHWNRMKAHGDISIR